MSSFRSADEFAPDAAVIDPGMRIGNAILRDLYAYWLTLRGDRAMPARHDLQPARMRRALPWIQLYEPVDDGADFVVRLVGTALTAAAGVDETGLRVSQSRHPHLAKRAAAAMRWVVRHAMPVRGAAPLSLEPDATHLAVEGIWLPLSNDGTRVHMVLAGTQIVALDDLRLGAAPVPIT